MPRRRANPLPVFWATATRETDGTVIALDGFAGVHSSRQEAEDSARRIASNGNTTKPIYVLEAIGYYPPPLLPAAVWVPLRKRTRTTEAKAATALVRPSTGGIPRRPRKARSSAEAALRAVQAHTLDTPVTITRAENQGGCHGVEVRYDCSACPGPFLYVTVSPETDMPVRCINGHKAGETA